MPVARRSCAFNTRNYLVHLQPSRALSVPDFLVPALARPWHRPLPSSRRHEHSDARQPSQPRPAGPPSTPARIPLPGNRDRSDIQAWTTAINALLPPHLQRGPSAFPDADQHVDSIDLARILLEAQKSSLDVLGHLCLAEQRWEAAIWVIKQLLESGPPAVDSTTEARVHAINVVWSQDESLTLQGLTENPIIARRVRPARKLPHSLQDLTAPPDSINPEKVLLKRALGQVWRTLGNLILEAAMEDERQDSGTMAHVLEILALLHHDGWIPDSVYHDHPVQHEYALHQPPTLHLLSSSIMRALSDAAMTAREASAKAPQHRLNASYFLGREIPGSRYKVHVSGVRPELCLELVLWSSLHGGWILDGAAILERMLSSPAEPAWRAISWKQLFKDEVEEFSPTPNSWRLFGKGEDEAAKAAARERVQRTVSSETITAYVDGLVNLMRVGVGSRGTSPEDLLACITKLKQFLDRSAYSLGSATWDSVMVRLLESGGVIPEKRPELLLSITRLASDFGSEVASHNALSHAPSGSTEAPYYYEPSTVSVSLLHRTMRSFIENGDIAGATRTLNTLVEHTDNNKQKSLQQFFESLKLLQHRPNQSEQPFTGAVPPIDFPAFDPQLPIPLLVKLLNLATETKSFHLGRWLLLSEELDGPIITRDMYDDENMAAAIVRFGTLAGENDLVLSIMKNTGFWSGKQQAHRIPNSLLTTLLESQVQLHRWESVRSMQDYVLRNPVYRPGSSLLATFAAELLRLSRGRDAAAKAQRSKACDAFVDLLFAWENVILPRLGNELYCVLGMLSSVDAQWKKFCSQFLTVSARHRVTLSTSNFNVLLAGVLDGYDSVRGRALVDMWCQRLSGAHTPYRAPGGLPTMPHLRVAKAQEYESRPDNIEIAQTSGATLVLQGRVLPNRHTIRAILRKVQQEEAERTASGRSPPDSERVETQKTLRWAAEKLYNFGFDNDDVVRDLGSLAEIADLQRPAQAETAAAPTEQIVT